MKEMNKQKIHNKNSLGLKMLALAVLPVLALGIVLLGVGMHAFSKSMENHVQKEMTEETKLILKILDQNYPGEFSLNKDEKGNYHIYKGGKDITKDTEFIDGMDNQATFYLNILMSENKQVVMLWIQKIFLEILNEEKILVKLLSLLLDYSYDDLYPTSQTIALACREHKSNIVKSAVFSLFGHWCNKDALNFLEAYEEPKERWLRLKYKTLKEEIKQKCYI